MSEPTARTGELHPAKRQSINAELEAWRANKMEPNFAIQCMFAEALWERWNAAIPTEVAAKDARIAELEQQVKELRHFKSSLISGVGRV